MSAGKRCAATLSGAFGCFRLGGRSTVSARYSPVVSAFGSRFGSALRRRRNDHAVTKECCRAVRSQFLEPLHKSRRELLLCILVTLHTPQMVILSIKSHLRCEVFHRRVGNKTAAVIPVRVISSQLHSRYSSALLQLLSITKHG